MSSGTGPTPPMLSWLEVTLTPAENGTTLDLAHEAHVDPDLWGRFGPGAVGVGWDLALVGLGLHIESGSAVDPETALAFPTSPVGVEFVRHAAASGTWAPCFRAAPAPPDALLRDGAGQLVGEAEAGKAAGH